MTDMQTKGKTKTNKAMVGPKQLTQTVVLSCLGGNGIKAIKELASMEKNRKTEVTILAC